MLLFTMGVSPLHLLPPESTPDLHPNLPPPLLAAPLAVPHLGRHGVGAVEPGP